MIVAALIIIALWALHRAIRTHGLDRPSSDDVSWRSDTDDYR